MITAAAVDFAVGEEVVACQVLEDHQEGLHTCLGVVAFQVLDLRDLLVASQGEADHPFRGEDLQELLEAVLSSSEEAPWVFAHKLQGVAFQDLLVDRQENLPSAPFEVDLQEVEASRVVVHTEGGEPPAAQTSSVVACSTEALEELAFDEAALRIVPQEAVDQEVWPRELVELQVRHQEEQSSSRARQRLEELVADSIEAASFLGQALRLL